MTITAVYGEVSYVDVEFVSEVEVSRDGKGLAISDRSETMTPRLLRVVSGID